MSDKDEDHFYHKIAKEIANSIDKIGYSKTIGLIETIKTDFQIEIVKEYLDTKLIKVQE